MERNRRIAVLAVGALATLFALGAHAAPIAVSGSGSYIVGDRFSSCEISFSGMNGMESLSIAQHARDTDCATNIPGFAYASYSDGFGFQFSGWDFSFALNSQGGMVTLYDGLGTVLREIQLLSSISYSDGVVDAYGDMVYGIQVRPLPDDSDPAAYTPEPGTALVGLPVIACLCLFRRRRPRACQME